MKTKVFHPKTAGRTSRAFSPGDATPPRPPMAPHDPAVSTFLGEKRRLSQAPLAPLKSLIAIHYWLLLNDYSVGVTILSHSIRRGGGILIWSLLYHDGALKLTNHILLKGQICFELPIEIRSADDDKLLIWNQSVQSQIEPKPLVAQHRCHRFTCSGSGIFSFL